MHRLLAMLALAVCAAQAEPITFYQHIAPIVYQSCAPCHRPGEPGPFPLLTYTDVSKHGSQIVSVIKRRYMPPWLPESGYGDFLEERRLTDDQIRTIEYWVRQGAPAGSPTAAPPLPKFVPGWQLGQPDLVIEAAAPYRLPASGPDQYWNFVLPLNTPGTRWVKAIEIRPGNIRAVHHANVLIDRSRSVRMQEKTPGAGFPGMDLNIESDAFDPDSHFLFWKPGGTPWIEPAGMAWRADPGADLVLNVHMQPTGKPETVQPSIGLYFTGEPATKFPMLLQLEHDGALDIPPGDADFPVSDDFVTPMDMDVLAVYPHAHYLGRLLEGYATLPGGTRKWLVRIPDWDPNWQSVYRYREPVFLPKGTVVSMRYHYDNSTANPRNPNQPPRRVRGGNEATDEMAHLWLQVLPSGAEDRRGELQEAIMLHRLEKYPGDFTSQFNLGALMLTRGRNADAVPYLRGAIAARPDHPVALNTLGAALLSAGNADEAAGFFERALQANPRYTNARYNLANALADRQRWEQAAAEFRKVLAENPDDPGGRQHLGEVLRLWGDERAKQGSLAEAAAHLRESLDFRQDDAVLHSDLGTVLARLGRIREAVPEFEAALRLDPNLEAARHNLQAARARLDQLEH
ncbi:MAG TPA: tetratricopeptide repeat protein [Bryobacteraceae bacterium]|jgi:tetratricopeptide (TPR) repeat protein|nr:tetratricopeptide repeat protein [Bryobacteraceae bacterium]